MFKIAAVVALVAAFTVTPTSAPDAGAPVLVTPTISVSGAAGVLG